MRAARLIRAILRSVSATMLRVDGGHSSIRSAEVSSKLPGSPDSSPSSSASTMLRSARSANSQLRCSPKYPTRLGLTTTSCPSGSIRDRRAGAVLVLARAFVARRSLAFRSTGPTCHLPPTTGRCAPPPLRHHRSTTTTGGQPDFIEIDTQGPGPPPRRASAPRCVRPPGGPQQPRAPPSTKGSGILPLRGSAGQGSGCRTARRRIGGTARPIATGDEIAGTRSDEEVRQPRVVGIRDMNTSARVLLVVAAIAAGIIASSVLGSATLGSSTEADIEAYKDATRSALSDADTNEANAEGAPQQQVVNGWLARDLALIQIDQNSAQLRQQSQTNQLLLVLVAMVAVLSVVPRGPTGRDDAVQRGPASGSRPGPPATERSGSQPSGSGGASPQVAPDSRGAAAPTTANAIRRCPHCSQVIALRADRCPHCAQPTPAG